MRRVGLAAAAALAACVVAVLVSMAGGPQAPFTRWAAPVTAAGPPGAQHPRQHGAGGGTPPGGNATRPAGPTPRPGSATPAPSATTASPAPTNRAGKTPPGLSSHKPSKSPPAGGH